MKEISINPRKSDNSGREKNIFAEKSALRDFINIKQEVS